MKTNQDRECPTCGKKVKSASLTQWIFSDRSCSCTTQREKKAPNRGNAHFPAIGDLIANRYEISMFIGEGHIGRVFEAVDRVSGDTVALKIWREDVPQMSESVNRFMKEIRTIRRLKHKNLVSVLDFSNSSSGAPFFVMNYCNGGSLAAELRTRNLDAHEALDLFIQIADALELVHGSGVVHRDLKPTNILFVIEDSERIPKIVDFGLAATSSAGTAGRSSMPVSGQFMGTPNYMSPEQCSDESLSSSSDIYSLGCVMYEALSGKPPFPGASAVKVMFQHINEKPHRFHDNLKVPQALEAVILRMLAKKPADRYQSMQDVRTDLIAVQRGNQPTKVRSPFFGLGDSITVRKSHLAAIFAFGALVGAAVSIPIELNSSASHQPKEQITRSPELEETKEIPELRPQTETPLSDYTAAATLYNLGVGYKAKGFTEKPRYLLKQAIILGKGSEIGERAQRFLTNQLPRYPVPDEASYLNIQGFNQRLGDWHGEAEKTWLLCIQKYPKFEWPYSNLGNLYAEEGRYPEAEKLLTAALQINPNYLNGWIHLYACKLKEKDLAGARQCAEKAHALDPDDPDVRRMNIRPGV